MKTAIHITPSRASQTAIRAVEKKGGTVFCKYYNELALRDSVKGNTERTQAAPTRKNDIRMSLPPPNLLKPSNLVTVWYTSWRNRGYLSTTALSKMPVVEERWKELSKQLTTFKAQEYDKAK